MNLNPLYTKCSWLRPAACELKCEKRGRESDACLSLFLSADVRVLSVLYGVCVDSAF